MKRWFSKELKRKNRTKAPVGIAHMCYQIKMYIFDNFSVKRKSSYFKWDKTWCIRWPFKRWGIRFFEIRPWLFFLSLQSWMNNFICPDLSQITCQLLGIESSWKLTIDSLKRNAQRSNVCTFTDIAKLGEVHQGYQNQVVSQELKTTKKDSQSRMVFQNRTTILVDLKIKR